jgi:DNA-binding LacI/PurR family transcriptional regulator
MYNVVSLLKRNEKTMTKASKQIKISDIARAAGVSTATVSRVLNDKGFVSDDVRRRVQEASDALGYQPQRVHKKAGDNGSIAVLTENLISPFFTQILSAIQEACLERGLIAYVLQVPNGETRRADLLQRLAQKSWAGVISAGFYQPADRWRQLHEELAAPIALFNTQAVHPCIGSIQVNFAGAAVTAWQHLLDLGHTRIAYMGDFSNEFSAAQFRGVERSIEQRGYVFPAEYRFASPHTPEGASQGVNRMMMLPPELRPTALLTFDDEFAIQVLNALRYHHLRVPEDISVVGFDNIQMAAHTDPPLTTVDVPKYRIGRQLVTVLDQLITNNGADQIGQVIIDGSLLVRGSTGPVLQK